MLQRRVMAGKEPLMGWNSDDDSASGSQHTSNFGKCGPIVPDVLQYIRGDHYVKGAGAKRELNTISPAVRSSSTALCSANRKFIGLNRHDPAEGTVRLNVSPCSAPVVENPK